MQFRDAPTRGVDTCDRRIGGFVARAITASRVAGERRVAFDIEDVVLDLKGQPDEVADTVERRVLRGRQVRGAGGCHPYAPANQGTGLEPVHELDFRQAEPAAHGREIEGLPAG